MSYPCSFKKKLPEGLNYKNYKNYKSINKKVSNDSDED